MSIEWFFSIGITLFAASDDEDGLAALLEPNATKNVMKI